MKNKTKAVKALILNEEKKVLILRSSRNKEVWDLPGGLIEADEGSIAALYREVIEETSLSIVVSEKMNSWYFLRIFDKKIVTVENYYCTLVSKSPDVILSNEHSEYQWIKPWDLKYYNLKNNSLLNSVNNFINLEKKTMMNNR